MYINNCIFNLNRGAKSVIQINQDNKEILKKNVACLINSSFHNNEGVSIYLSNHLNLHVVGEVLFENNVAEDGAGIYINDHSTVIFDDNSNIKFINNTVYHNGAAILLNNNSSAIFGYNSKVTFVDNKASNGTIYANHRSGVMFIAICKITFSNNSASQYGAGVLLFILLIILML